MTAMGRVDMPDHIAPAIATGTTEQRLDAARGLDHEALPCCPLGAAQPTAQPTAQPATKPNKTENTDAKDAEG